MKQNIKWIDCLDKSGPNKEGIYFITRETDPPFVEEAAYDPKIGEFVGCDEDGYIVAWSPDAIEEYKGDGSESDERWNVFLDELPEEGSPLLVTCESVAGKKFIQHAIVMNGNLLTLDSYMWPYKPYLRVLAWMYPPAPYRGRR